MNLDMIRFGNCLEGVTSMPGLTAALLATSLPQALRLFLQPITRRRLAAVPAILGNLIFQLLEPFRYLAKGLIE
jgi:hypothetical protein